jgi:hypothetical protein
MSKLVRSSTRSRLDVRLKVVWGFPLFISRDMLILQLRCVRYVQLAMEKKRKRKRNIQKAVHRHKSSTQGFSRTQPVSAIGSRSPRCVHIILLKSCLPPRTPVDPKWSNPVHCRFRRTLSCSSNVMTPIEKQKETVDGKEMYVSKQIGKSPPIHMRRSLNKS